MATLVSAPAGASLSTVKLLTGHTPTVCCLGLLSEEDVIKGFLCLDIVFKGEKSDF